MLKRTAYRLTLINAVVFIVVLSISAGSVFLLSTNRIDAKNREILQHLLKPLEYDTLWADAHDFKEDDGDLKDYLPNLAQTVQWFDAEGRLLAEKGPVAVKIPLHTDAAFEEQRSPHALLLTRLISRNGKKLAYFRIAMDLAKSDDEKWNLLFDLMMGTLLATASSGVAVFWLVRQGLKPVELSMRQLADFSADASHELQNPVMAIKTNGAIALKYPDGMRASDKEKLTTMVNAADQMAATIDALLRLADLEQSLPVTDLKTIHVAKLATELRNDLDALAAKKLVKINVDTNDPDISFIAVEADAKTALLNVLRNAIQYSRNGDRVNFVAKKVGKYIEFKIEDFGIGIAASDLPRIFDRFWRSDEARSYRSGGNGLGLAITKNIVDRYKGSINVESVLGAGTAVTLRFPEVPPTEA